MMRTGTPATIRGAVRRYLLPLPALLLVSCGFSRLTTDYKDLDETYVRESFVASKWLPPLRDGSTTLRDLTAALGEPTETFRSGSVYVYRLMLTAADQDSTAEMYRSRSGIGESATTFNEELFNLHVIDHNERRKEAAETGRLRVWRNERGAETFFQDYTREAEYNLILVFDSTRVLAKHSFLRVIP